MTVEPTPADLVGRSADERLLGQDVTDLPTEVGRPPERAPSASRARLVGVGAALTGVTLLLGVGLIVLGAIEAAVNGLGGGPLTAAGLGLALVGTHWGWVHVAEATADAVERRRDARLGARRREWLAAIDPYPRAEVSTGVDADGSIHLVCTRHRPAPAGDAGFTFVSEVTVREAYSADAPAALVAERAEILRRQAAIETERERERFTVAADAYRAALFGREDDEQRSAARRAASEALSEQINRHLRDPPLAE